MALSCIALALWCISTFIAQRAGDMTHSVSARWPDGGVSPAQLIGQEEFSRQDGAQNRPELTLWDENPSGQISDNGDRTAEASVIELFGNTEEICFEELLVGAFPSRGDADGCAISEKTAFDLWGSRDVSGKTILVNGSVYSVRGVFRGNEGLVLVQRDSSSTKSFHNMQLRFHDGGSQAEAESFLIRAGFSGAQFLDLPLLGWFINALAQLPIFILGISILIRLLRRGLRLRSFPLLLSGYALPAGVAGATCLYLMGFPWSIPQRLIPTKWSDFEFWGRTVGSFIKSIKVWLSAAPTRWDMTFWPKLIFTAFLVIGATVLLAAAMERVKIKTGRGFMIGCLLSIGTILFIAVLLASHGGLKIDIGVWLMPWLWLGVDYGLYVHDIHLKLKGGQIRE